MVEKPTNSLGDPPSVPAGKYRKDRGGERLSMKSLGNTWRTGDSAD